VEINFYGTELPKTMKEIQSSSIQHTKSRLSCMHVYDADRAS